MPDPSAAPVPSPSSPVRIILVDDDPLTRAAIKPLLRPREDYAVVAEAGDGHEAIDVVGRTEADIVLMDLGMPVMDGIEATRQICAAPRHPHVVALTTWDVDDAVVRVIEAGAVGYLLKYSASEELDAGLRRVMMGESVLSPGALAELLRYVRSQPVAAAPVVAAYDARAEERQRAVAQARQAAAETEGTPTSARNRLTGLVMAVKKDKVMAEVQLRCGPFVVTSLMSAESADRLGLVPGTLATAVVKATTVIVETPEGLS